MGQRTERAAQNEVSPPASTPCTKHTRLWKNFSSPTTDSSRSSAEAFLIQRDKKGVVSSLEAQLKSKHTSVQPLEAAPGGRRVTATAPGEATSPGKSYGEAERPKSPPSPRCCTQAALLVPATRAARTRGPPCASLPPSERGFGTQGQRLTTRPKPPLQ